MIEELVGLSYHTYTDSGFISLKKALDIDIIHKYGRVVSAVVIRPFFFQEGVGCLVYIIVFLKALLCGETEVGKKGSCCRNRLGIFSPLAHSQITRSSCLLTPIMT